MPLPRFAWVRRNTPDLARSCVTLVRHRPSSSAAVWFWVRREEPRITSWLGSCRPACRPCCYGTGGLRRKDWPALCKTNRALDTPPSLTPEKEAVIVEARRTTKPKKRYPLECARHGPSSGSQSRHRTTYLEVVSPPAPSGRALPVQQRSPVRQKGARYLRLVPESPR